jgi:transcriptional regulator with GAF, ATPase, and Fis domain
VLFTGKSDTGKEIVARTLLFSSPRAEKPLLSVNCSVLSENLL